MSPLFHSLLDTKVFQNLGIPYHIHVTTGDVRGAGTDANVFVILFGGKDGETNSGKLFLEDDSKNNFERGKTDIFTVESTEQFSPLHHLRLGHDNSGAASGWYLEKVSYPISFFSSGVH